LTPPGRKRTASGWKLFIDNAFDLLSCVLIQRYAAMCRQMVLLLTGSFMAVLRLLATLFNLGDLSLFHLFKA
jgi:hypothetical protein